MSNTERYEAEEWAQEVHAAVDLLLSHRYDSTRTRANVVLAIAALSLELPSFARSN